MTPTDVLIFFNRSVFLITYTVSISRFGFIISYFPISFLIRQIKNVFRLQNNN